jgi:cysteine-S-conjugate beta-lyase
MTQFDFDTVVNRRGTDSIKWSYYGDDVLPLWVADMDFRSPDVIMQAVKERLDHGIFGYALDIPGLREVICERMARLYGWTVQPNQIAFLSGLVTGINVVTRAYAEPETSVLMTTPIYPPFLGAPVGWGQTLCLSDLIEKRDGTRLHYEIDFDDFEQKAADPATKLFLLCNPHNPVGRVYTRDELARMAEICEKHDVLICSDEIHCDLLLDERPHIPIASLSENIAARTITLMAPSKTFNVPGLGAAFAIVQNPDLMKKLHQAAEGVVPLVNVLGLTAMKAAYQDGQVWLDALLVYLRGNRDFLTEYAEKHFPDAALTHPEGTYLGWLDFRAFNLPDDNPYKFFLDNAKVALGNGKIFGENSTGFVRINFGCPRSILEETLDKMRTALETTKG